MDSLFDSLVARYKALKISHPALKAITLAQWMLESGRGSSALAREHLNFGGLKWRSELLGFATPVAYRAHDGLDYYCKFGSLDAFIVGYWRFLARTPYQGWEKEADKGAEAFMRFIGPIYNPAGNAYVNQVLALLPEAEKRLKAARGGSEQPNPAVPGTPVVIVLDPGHGGTAIVGGSSPNNANSPSGEREKDWTLDIARRTRTALLSQALAADRNLNVLLTRETDINIGLSARAAVAREAGAALFLSIHFNGFDGKARGVETLISVNNVNRSDDLAFARVIQRRLLAAWREFDSTTRDRGVKEQSLGVLSDIALGNSIASHPCRACLVEIEFMDTPAVDRLLRLHPDGITAAADNAGRRQHLANALAAALLAQI